jgi:hypothetical protein
MIWTRCFCVVPCCRVPGVFDDMVWLILASMLDLLRSLMVSVEFTLCQVYECQVLQLFTCSFSRR